MSLPHTLGISDLTQIPKSPYLRADERLCVKWASRVFKRARSGELRVGLCWNGRSGFGDSRSVPLQELRPLTGIMSIDFFSLQKGPHDRSTLQELEMQSIMNFEAELDRESGPFMDTAALITNMDLVISCDTAVAHLAGALGKPVWLMLPFAAEWRWLRGTSSPWYPTARLFRQKKNRDWPGVISDVCEALQREAREPQID